MHRSICVLVLVLLVPATAWAHQRPPSSSLADRASADEIAELAGPTAPSTPTIAGGGARRRVPPVDPLLTAAELRAALQTTRADLEQCLATAGIVGALRVTARVTISHSLALDITTPRSEPGSRACAELVVRRAITGLAARPIAHSVRASLRVAHRAPRPVPAPAPGSDLAAFEGPVHAAIDRDRTAMLQCLSGAAPGVVGNAVLRVSLASDGTLTLTNATLPPGVPAGPALPCLSARMAQLRFAPAPRTTIAIEHTLPLGL